MTGPTTPDLLGDDPRELFSALLDGELAPAEVAALETWLVAHPEARAELDELGEVRTAVRELPAVDPPAGFFETILADGPTETAAITSLPPPASPATSGAGPDQGGNAEVVPLASRRRRNRTWLAGAAGVAAAVAAAFVLVLGITPATDAVTPPVSAFAEHHDSMAKTDPTAATSPTVAGTPLEKLADEQAGAMASPYSAPAQLDGGYQRRAVYHGDGVVHVVYGRGGSVVSMYEQPGRLNWDTLPSEGKRVRMGEIEAWESNQGRQMVVVIDQQSVVVTIVSTAPAEETMRLAASVPPPPPPTLAERARHGAAEAVRSFGLTSR